PVQMSLPVAVTPAGRVGPQFVGIYIPMYGTASPGARTRLSRTSPAWSSMIVTLPSVALPVLLTIPVKNTKSPWLTGAGGQYRVTAIRGVVMRGQAALAVPTTLLPRQNSLPRAVIVSTHGPQQSYGAI